MRIERLDLTRFGNFTDVSLGLLSAGVNVIVGPNEAGKTTAMAAIRQLLFGIPVRTDHAFLHDMRDLRIAGLLSDENGGQFEFTRVKRNTGALRNSDDEPIDESVLRKLLLDVDVGVYNTLFSISHEEIVSGGIALLRNDGELGQALFGAGTGLARLNSTTARLDKRAGELFKSSASKPLVNAAIKEYKDALSRVRDLSQGAAEATGLDEQLGEVEGKHQSMVEARREFLQRKNLLERVKAVRPGIVKLRDAQRLRVELEGAGALVDLDVADRLEKAQIARHDGESSRRQAELDVERLETLLAELVVDEAVLGQVEMIDLLVEELGVYRINMKDLPGLNKQVGDLERDLDRLRRLLPAECLIGSDGHPQLSADRRSSILRLARQHAVLTAAVEQRKDRCDETSEALRQERDRLAAQETPPDLSTLTRVVARVRIEGQLETAQDQCARDIAAAEADIDVTLKSLGLVADPRRVDSLGTPGTDAVHDTDTAISQAAGEVTGSQRTIRDLGTRGVSLRRDLDVLLAGSSPPSQEDLVQARMRRDQGWRFIRDAWLGAGADDAAVAAWAGGEALDVVYEAEVSMSDSVSDRLRLEADAVAKRVLLERDSAEIAEQIQQRTVDLESAKQRKREASDGWEKLWEPLGVKARSRKEMDAWAERVRGCAAQSALLRQRDADLAKLAEAIARHAADLRLHLAKAGSQSFEGLSLSGLLDVADELCATAELALTGHAALTRSVEDLESGLQSQTTSLEKARSAMALWRQQWAGLVAEIGLSESAAPDDAEEVIKAVVSIEQALTQLSTTQLRVIGIERRNEEIRARLNAILGELSDQVDVSSREPEAAIGTLRRLLSAANEAQTAFQSLAAERNQKREALDHATAKIQARQGDIDELVRIGGVTDEAGLAAAVDRSSRHSYLSVQIDQTTQELLSATGLPQPQLDTEVSQFQGVDIDVELDELTNKLDEVDGLISDTAQHLGELRTQRSLIDDSGAAAEAAEFAQQKLALVGQHSDEYVQIVLARTLLQEQIEQYRERHQGPILGRARDLFSKLTLGRYSGLDTDTDERGVPVILAKISNNRSVPVSALSTGTRDQMYLALRLAAIEHYVDRRGSLPLILDDLFVHFDDARTEAGLQVLDELSSRLQVLLFTHHEAVAEQAREVLTQDRLLVSRL